MEVVKQVVKLESEGYLYVIKNKKPSHKLSSFIQMFVMAQQDFPDLTPSEVSISDFQNEFSNRIFGIEWESKTPPKDGWKMSKNVEHIL